MVVNVPQTEVIMFPISMIHWVFGTLLKDVFSGVYARVEFLYEKLLNA